MKTITRDVFEALQRTHPIEAAVWQMWIRTGEARVVEVPAC